MSSQGIVSSKKANNYPGLCPIKGQKSGLCTQTSARIQFLSLSLSTTRTSPPCQMLVIHPAFFLSYVLSRDPQGWLRSNKLLNRTISCELLGYFIPLYPSMSTDPIQPHSLPGREIIQHLWHCCTSGDTVLATGRAVRANTCIFLWSNIHLNFTNTGEDSTYLSLKNCIILPYWAFFPQIAHRIQPQSHPSSCTHL